MSEMTNERVKDILLSFGANPDHWPEDEREAVSRAIAAAPHLFAAELEEARAVDGALADFAVPEMPADLLDKVLATQPVRPVTITGGGRRNDDRRGWGLGGMFGGAAALNPAAGFGAAFTALALGVLIGIYALPGSGGSTLIEDQIWTDSTYGWLAAEEG